MIQIIHHIYKTAGGIHLPLLIYRNTLQKDSRPALICIHGGAWKARTDNSPWDGDYIGEIAKMAAERGAVGISFSYRSLSDKGGNASLADLYEDCLDAMRYIVSNAEELGIDRRRLTLLGDSAGGHLAACLGTLPLFRCESDLMPALVVACNAIFDLSDPKWQYAAWKRESDQRLTNLNESEYLSAISPIEQIGPKTPPFLLLHGTADTVVSPKQTERFAARMRDNGRDVSVHWIPEANHAFILPRYYPNQEVTQETLYFLFQELERRSLLP